MFPPQWINIGIDCELFLEGAHILMFYFHAVPDPSITFPEWCYIYARKRKDTHMKTKTCRLTFHLAMKVFCAWQLDIWLSSSCIDLKKSAELLLLDRWIMLKTHKSFHIVSFCWKYIQKESEVFFFSGQIYFQTFSELCLAICTSHLTQTDLLLK